MSQQLRFIVDKLNEPPFSNKFNMVTFDSLDAYSLLQVLNSVLAEISPEHKLDLRQEQPEQTAVRVFGFLRVLHYNPKVDQNAFRQGLLQGDKPITYALLAWLLEKMPELKKRSYLSKYLAKVDVPVEFQQDEQILETIELHTSLMDTFKELHKTIEQQRNSKFNVADVRKDISSMEEEKEQLVKRTQRLKQKAQAIPNCSTMLEAAQKLRKEKDKEMELTEQMGDQKTQLLRAEQRLDAAQKELEEVQKTTTHLTPEKLLGELEEENRLKSILTEENIPKKVESLRQESRELENVLAEPALNDKELDEIRDEIAVTNEEVGRLREKRMPGRDPAQDKLALFRQQASIIARKREKAAEEYKEVMDEVESTRKEVTISKDKLKEFDGGLALRDDEFKRYVSKLRAISVEYRAKKAELSALKAECGVLDRTVEILKSRDENVQELLEILEKKKGVEGYQDTQEAIEGASAAKSDLDEITGKRLTDMTAILRELNEKIEGKKALLAPLIKEVRPLRLKHHELQSTHSEKKVLYDGVAVGLQTKRAGLEQAVQDLWSKALSKERECHLLQCRVKCLELQEERVAAELRSYVGSGSTEKVKKSLRDEYTYKIQEAENLSKILRDEQKDLKETHSTALEQVKMWRDLKKLMEAKKESFVKGQEEQFQAKAVEQKMIAEENRLVII